MRITQVTRVIFKIKTKNAKSTIAIRACTSRKMEHLLSCKQSAMALGEEGVFLIKNCFFLQPGCVFANTFN